MFRPERRGNTQPFDPIGTPRDPEIAVTVERRHKTSPDLIRRMTERSRATGPLTIFTTNMSEAAAVIL
jgi:hypothetical protein